MDKIEIAKQVLDLSFSCVDKHYFFPRFNLKLEISEDDFKKYNPNDIKQAIENVITRLQDVAVQQCSFELELLIRVQNQEMHWPGYDAHPYEKYYGFIYELASEGNQSITRVSGNIKVQSQPLSDGCFTIDDWKSEKLAHLNSQKQQYAYLMKNFNSEVKAETPFDNWKNITKNYSPKFNIDLNKSNSTRAITFYSYKELFNKDDIKQ